MIVHLSMLCLWLRAGSFVMVRAHDSTAPLPDIITIAADTMVAETETIVAETIAATTAAVVDAAAKTNPPTKGTPLSSSNELRATEAEGVRAAASPIPEEGEAEEDTMITAFRTWGNGRVAPVPLGPLKLEWFDRDVISSANADHDDHDHDDHDDHDDAIPKDETRINKTIARRLSKKPSELELDPGCTDNDTWWQCVTKCHRIHRRKEPEHSKCMMQCPIPCSETALPTVTPSSIPSESPSISTAPTASMDPSVSSMLRGQPSENPTISVVPSPGPSTRCSGDVNVCLAVDASGSVTPPGWVQTIYYAKLLIAELDNVTNGGGEYSAVEFNATATIVSNLTDKHTLSLILDNLAYYGGMTNHHDALNKCQDTLISANVAGQPEKARIIILITDGLPTVEQDGTANRSCGSDCRNHVISVANGITQTGTRIVPVFAVPNPAETEITYMETLSSDGTVLTNVTFDTLPKTVTNLVGDIIDCKTTRPSIAASQTPSSSDWPTSQPSSQLSTHPSIDPLVPTFHPSKAPSLSVKPSSILGESPSISTAPSGQPSEQGAGCVDKNTRWQCRAKCHRIHRGENERILRCRGQCPIDCDKMPSGQPSENPTISVVPSPGDWPTSRPSSQPSTPASMDPSVSSMPSGQPSENPSASDWPTSQPSELPSLSGRPSSPPTGKPSSLSNPTNAPTNSQGPGEQLRAVVCGRGFDCTEGDGYFDIVKMNSSQEVRCCRDCVSDGPCSSSWKQKCGDYNPEVYARSKQRGKCYVEDFCSAMDVCADVFGGRLCTPEEVLESCAKGTGCKYDKEMVWACMYEGGRCGVDEECCSGKCGGEGVCLFAEPGMCS